jgi:hypothetical protein
VPHVRDRAAPAAATEVRKRRERNLILLAPDPARPGARFGRAFDWFRAAVAYARRRGYPSRAVADLALTRREEILDAAERSLTGHGDRIAALLRKPPRRDASRAACGKAGTGRERVQAAEGWLLRAYCLAARQDPDTQRQADVIKDQAAAELIEWAKEMDADDYPA